MKSRNYAFDDVVQPLRALYRVAPRWFRESCGRVYGCLPYSVRYGPLLGKAQQFLAESQYWSAQQHRDYFCARCSTWCTMRMRMCRTIGPSCGNEASARAISVVWMTCDSSRF